MGLMKMPQTKSYSKKVWDIASLYLTKCTDQEPFVNGKPSKNFWAVRNFFWNQGPSEVDKVFNYLSSLPEGRQMGITAVFRNANRMNQETQWEQQTINQKGDTGADADWLSQLRKL